MIKKWEIMSSPAPQFPDRKLLLLSSKSRADAEKLKESFAGYVGVVFKSEAADFQWAAYIYGASANIEKLINQELKELSLEHPAEVKTEKKTVVKEQSSADIIKDEFPKKKAKPKEETISEPAAISAGPAIEQFERQGTFAVKSPAAPAVSELLETFDKPSLQKKAEPVAPVLETFEKPDEAPAAAAPVIEKFEQFTPDQSAEKPLS
ncbi:hypothetical protein KJ633_02655, partial [bacterium]|nr:hypothetical protein [bacterium]MBU3955338.1 hypothetical protein [bacterium]